jgi:hypothetical protein
MMEDNPVRLRLALFLLASALLASGVRKFAETCFEESINGSRPELSSSTIAPPAKL